MGKRIRYNKADNVLTSNQTYQVGEKTVRVEIDLNAKSYKIYDVATQEVLKSGTEDQSDAVKAQAYMMKAVKRAFHDLGLNFTEEKRNRGPNKPKESEPENPAA